MNLSDVSAHLGRWGDPMPQEICTWEGDYIISYLSRWVVPEHVLNKARIAAINFHPASPDYPGIGCNNFALYDNAQEYGTTCHHMTTAVDTGTIIKTRLFPVFPEDNVATLLARTYDEQLILFYEIADLIKNEKELPISDEQWTRKPFTRTEFNKLSKITPDMGKEEIARRIRATSFGTWKPTVELHGFVFELKA